MNTYPALSIRAPWWAYILDTSPHRKLWENRVWHPSRRPKYRGPLYIHASTWWSLSGVTDTAQLVVQEFNSRGIQPEFTFPHGVLTYRDMQALGGHIVGMVDLVDIVDDADAWDSPWVSTVGMSPPNHCALRLENPRPIVPVAYRGRLGLFNLG